MKIKVSYTKAERDEKELRRFSMDAGSFMLGLAMKKKRLPFAVEIAIAALTYEYELCKKSRKKSKFVAWLLQDHLKWTPQEIKDYYSNKEKK